MSGGIEKPMSAAEIDALSRASGSGPGSQARRRRLCDVPGCGHRHSAKGKCGRHYNLAARIGEAAARLVPGAVARKCSACASTLGANNQSGRCRTCRIHWKRYGIERIGGGA